MKECRKCGETWPLDDFYRQATSKDGRGAYCKLCNKREVARYALSHPDQMRASKLRYKYGIDSLDYAAMFQGQGGVCALCGSPPSGKYLAVDHCHETGRVRGLLCGRCNTGLGHFRDSQEVLLRAAEYVGSG